MAVKHVESAQEMLDACQAALPADMAVFAAAVADWRVAGASAGKIKKVPGAAPPALELVTNPDILATIAAAGPRRPRLVVGFAAETDDLMANAQAKRARKNADWIVANDVSPATGIMGGEENAVHLITADGGGGLATAGQARSGAAAGGADSGRADMIRRLEPPTSMPSVRCGWMHCGCIRRHSVHPMKTRSCLTGRNSSNA